MKKLTDEEKKADIEAGKQEGEGEADSPLNREPDTGLEDHDSS